MVAQTFHKTREDWLQAAVEEFREFIAERADGASVPAVRVGVGFPSSGARGAALAECWTPLASGDGTHEIFIRADRNTTREQRQDILSTLLHEVVHASAGIPAGHGPQFKAIAEKVDLTGKMTATLPSDDLRDALNGWVEYGALGAYPMATFNAGVGVPEGPGHSGGHFGGSGKPQVARQIKAQCGTCGYTLRVARSWLAVAVPECPNPECDNHGQAMQVEQKG